MILTDEHKQRLRDFFKEREEIILVYIFGSQARGEPSYLSDVDIAVYLDERLNREQRFDMRLRLIAKASNILSCGRVDLIILNDTPIRLYHNVLKKGVVLHSRDELKRINTEVKVISRYLDQKYYQDRHNKILLEQIKKEGIL